MKFEVEVKDFWLYEGDLEEKLVKAIKRSVVAQIHEDIDDKIEKIITSQVKSSIMERIQEQTNKIIDEFIENGKVKDDYSKESLSVREYIEKKFITKNGWGNPSDKVEKLAKSFGKELRDRYDVMFATQIVLKLEKEGLLKESVAKMLREKNTI